MDACDDCGKWLDDACDCILLNKLRQQELELMQLRAKAVAGAKLFEAVMEHNACWHSGCGPCGACKALAEYAAETGVPFDGRYAEYGSERGG